MKEKTRLKEIAAIIGGKLNRSDNTAISGIAGIEKARGDQITFISDKKYIEKAGKTKAAAIVVSEGIRFKSSCPQILVKDANVAFAKLAEIFYSQNMKPGIDASAKISKKAKLGKNVSIMANAVIGESEIGDGCVIMHQTYIGDGVRLGKNCKIYQNASILGGSQIGNNVIIHAGTVIGSDGFGYYKEGIRYKKIPQIGNVVIDDDVEIGANCTIDRARLDRTYIGRGVKIDNLVHIAHNVEIGEDTVILAYVGIAGSAVIGKRCLILGQVGIGDHINVGDDAILASQSGITKDVQSKAFVSGTPARDKNQLYKELAYLSKLPELYELIKKRLKV